MSGITVQCVSCKTKKKLTLDEARQIDGSAMCDCGMPMVAIKAELKSRRRGGDLRDIFRQEKEPPCFNDDDVKSGRY